MKIVEDYVRDLRSIRYSDVGTDALTYYHPLLTLLNAVGRSLKPGVKALGNLADEGAGHPDVGLFGEAQAAGQLPERGVIEVKGTADDVAYWRNVPAAVWEFTIGGYQVLKKWLSYRERPLLGRDLKLAEVMDVTHIARRIAALALMQPALDANYRAVKAAAYAWPSS